MTITSSMPNNWLESPHARIPLEPYGVESSTSGR